MFISVISSPATFDPASSISMAASADHLYPSKDEIRVIQFEIITLENEVADAQKVIEQAHLRIDELTRQLNERKARIAPVKKAGFDVLSSIFERCSEIDWKSPLTIATVSHRWREVILHTPRAWCFINLSSLNEAGIEAYFERSGQCGLHASLYDPSDIWLITPVAHRIQCLVFPFISEPVENLTFPMLTRLRNSPPIDFDTEFNGYFSDTAITTSSRFPHLRHLELRNTLLRGDNCEELPSLQTLKLTVLDGDGWGELLKACKSSLISLEITGPGDGYTPEVPQIELPNLRYLKVIDKNRFDCSWMSPLTTPALRVYWEKTYCREGQEPRERAESITHLRLKRVPSIFPTQLRVLQLETIGMGMDSLINDLRNDPSLCPHLEILEFGRRYVPDSRLAQIKKMLDGYDWHARPRLVRRPTMTAQWSVSLPDEIEVEVRH
jgi:hypothetical protein